MKVYIVIELTPDTPRILGVFRHKSDAEKLIGTTNNWINIVEQSLR